jgi:hypothetical protein
MQVIFDSRDPQGAELRDQAVQRLRFVMRRLAWRVSRARLRLSDVNGPRGGVDKRCQVALNADDGGRPVVITAMARDWRDAIDSALARAAQVLLRRHGQAPERRRRERGQPVSDARVIAERR